MKHNVAIVDDHTLLSQAIGELVNSFNDFENSKIFKNGKELLDYLESASDTIEIVLMDINMPILNGIETTRIISERYPKIIVLALSIEINERTIIEMLRAGAKGYLLKDIEKQVLEEALIEVLEKGFYHTNITSQILINSLSPNYRDNILKERELEFLKLACTELTYKQIAQKMYLSPKTIEGYRDSIYEKLNIKNRIGMVLYAIKNDIVKP